MGLAQGIRLEVRQAQSLVMTPQVQQGLRLLQMSNIELAGAVDREVTENPFLQRADGPAGLTPAAGSANGVEPPLPPPSAGSLRAADCSLSLQRTAGRAPDEDRSSFEARLTRPRGLREHLLVQVLAMLPTPRLRRGSAAIVESVEDDGYLREGDEVLAARFALPIADVAAVRAALQRCEPTGVGARDLAECLALQLRENDRLDPAMAALVANLPLVARADFPELMRRCRVDPEDLHDMIHELKRLDPKPGLSFAADEPPVVVPDLFIMPLPAGRWRVELNSGTLPRVLVDSDYHAELARHAIDRGAKDYLSERMQSANWLAKALDQRARTMLRVAKAIFARQLAFLEGGGQHLRPLVLRDIAEATGLHESTVSRATADKYVATPHGTFALKYFFTTALAATTGEQAHSAEAIRQQIKRMIDREQPLEVLSDDQIMAELKAKGVVIARRTVAKYRESLGIASSVERRRAKALGR